ncbi:MAG TPA: peptidase M16 [Bacteroidales bacterium]|nr:MAG: peptidase M16 [Bacteroidetes bacterium GWE2_42_24]OFY30158.1 MAG: peptidase M16 [Bacteroidetes bacterium GWF2_43_11]HAQ64826.1 peptidase M16 [Bacteroidales bacterium]HBZ67937.1 peptidase M16 [Bacteroidales bacterium]
MIEFNRFTLDNGLRLLVHTDTTTPMVAINVLYDVGSKDEHPGHTGFAHLFEHLMFGGSLNIESYDRELEKVGGENNAFTTSDYTNYYLQIPANNVETGFRLESDRMLSLSFSEKKLDVQRNVVMEEFKQSYLNKPYGDLWLELKPLAYTHHPYRWPTIGSDISHIANATLEEVKAFFNKYYHPANAILSVAGNITPERALHLTRKWFGDIPAGAANERKLPAEPPQQALRTMTIFRDVPYDVALLAWKMPQRADKDYLVCELLAELLAGGESSLLISKLVNDTELLTEVECFLSEEIDHGLFCLFAKPRLADVIYPCVDTVNETLMGILTFGINSSELEKVKNKALTAIALGQMSIHNKAMTLAFGELLGDANRINIEPQRYQEITMEDLLRVGEMVFQKQNCSILYYRSKNIA